MLDKSIATAKTRLAVLYFAIFLVALIIFIGLPVGFQVHQYNRLQDVIIRTGEPKYIVSSEYTPDDNSNAGRFPGNDLTPAYVQGVNGAGIRLIGNATRRAQEENLQLTLSLGVLGLLASIVVSYLLARRTLEPLIESLDKQNRFVADASHELRTPLAVIKTEAEVLQRDPNASHNDYRDFLESAMAEVDYLTKLTHKLLSSAKLNSGSVKLLSGQVGLKSILAKLTKQFASLAAGKQIAIEFTASDSKLQVLGDKILLQELFTIILDNALKFNSQAGQIKIVLTNQANKVQVKISNSGPEVAPADLQKIFTPFYSSSASRTEKNHGLGLTIAKQIVDLHRASIKFESTGGMNTVTVVFAK